jgi:hypothetical protein
MTRTPEDRPELGRDEREFVERLAASFTPPPLGAEGRVAFDETLAAKIARRRARLRWSLAGGLPAAAAASLALAWLVLGDGTPAPAPPTASRIFPAEAWEEEVLLLDASFESEAEADQRTLPEEYLAIESAML